MTTADAQGDRPNAQAHFKSLYYVCQYPIDKSLSHGQVKGQGVEKYIPYTVRTCYMARMYLATLREGDKLRPIILFTMQLFNRLYLGLRFIFLLSVSTFIRQLVFSVHFKCLFIIDSSSQIALHKCYGHGILHSYLS